MELDFHHDRLQTIHDNDLSSYTRIRLYGPGFKHIHSHHSTTNMASPLLPLKPHLGSLDLESLSPTSSAASSLQPSRKRLSRAQPTTIDPDQRSGPIATRRQEIQRQYRKLSSIAFSSLVMGS
ncbi:unnamed protein product [Zymoseptoria tritici ST99CH_3D1]|uniref:Uncharacterized protein n=1 Tax=Zymoseptoria tritici ST99CH_1E4 TaxID=1276532 RepID=A0A2H1GXJ4_ZYMTR|nr:unnamed protein product [Zymoseptoria tritici ST99CH_1E4]SMR61225.1 unnamed protein product [Zymoseptoria tritici ST99CH_3D1]